MPTRGVPDPTPMLPLLGIDDTAFIVHDLDVVSERLDVLESAFPDSTRHAVAVKTMPHRRVLSFVARRGFGLEAASFEEVELALEAGVEPSSLIFDSPVKTRREIQLCESRCPGLLMNANSLGELDRYRFDTQSRIGLRINPLVQTGAAAPFDVSTGQSKFGVPVTDADSIVDAARNHGFTALHMHIGSGLSDPAAYVESAASLVELAEACNLARGEGQPRISILDIGGGLAPESVGSGGLMVACGELLAEQCPELFTYDVWTEFGQWVHAGAGWAASRVEYVEERTTPMAYLHVGADLLMRRAQGLQSRGGYRVFHSDGTPREGPRRAYDLAGPLCFAGDMVDHGVLLPRLEPGDWIVIEDTGANTLGLWSRHCSRDIPKVFGVEGGRVSLWDLRRSVRA